ncbi:MAG: hypothetical protein ABII22_04955 [Candidatus Micrarchaeota archaeon]
MLEEVRKEVEPREFLRSKKDQIGELMGEQIGDKRIDKLWIWQRIPFYDLYHYLKSKAVQFKDLTVTGRAIGSNIIYVATHRAIRAKIEKYKLYELEMDSEPVRKQIEKMIMLVRNATVHEFIHLVYKTRYEQEEKRLQRKFLESGVAREILSGKISDAAWARSYDGVAMLPRQEMVTLCTTSLILNEPVLEGWSGNDLSEYQQVKERLQRLRGRDLRDLEVFEAVHDFFTEDAQLVAISFLAEVMPRLGQQVMERILNDPPSFKAMMSPETY